MSGRGGQQSWGATLSPFHGCISGTVGGNSVTWCDQSCAQLDVTETKELIVDLRRTLRYLWAPDWSCCSQSLSDVSRIHPPRWNGQRAPLNPSGSGVQTLEGSHRSSHRDAAEVKGVFSEVVGLSAVEFGVWFDFNVTY